MPTENYKWYPDVRRYRDRAGRFVSQDRITAHVTQTIANFSEWIAERTYGLIDDFTIDNFAVWANEVRAEIRAMHHAMTIVALGGKDASIAFNTQNAQLWHYTEEALARQMRYFDNFVFSVMTGQVPLDGRMVNRARMYSQSGFGAYQNAIRMREGFAGAQEERRVQYSVNPCDDCTEYADEGWQPVGTLPEIGDSQCGGNCRCEFEFRSTEPLYSADED